MERGCAGGCACVSRVIVLRENGFEWDVGTHSEEHCQHPPKLPKPLSISLCPYDQKSSRVGGALRVDGMHGCAYPYAEKETEHFLRAQRPTSRAAPFAVPRVFSPLVPSAPVMES